MWGVEDEDLSGRWDWKKLRKDVLKHGVRNSLLVAPMPTASTSQILGNNECFEPYTSNIYTRRVLSGEFIIVNKHLLNDLVELNLWNEDMKQDLMAANGSIQDIEGIPDDLKELYKTVWEMKQKNIIQLAVDRGPFICQTQSMNLFFEEPSMKTLSSALFFGWKSGLKTGAYYIRSQPKVQAQQFTINPQLRRNKNDSLKLNMVNSVKRELSKAERCAIDNPGAVSYTHLTLPTSDLV